MIQVIKDIYEGMKTAIFWSAIALTLYAAVTHKPSPYQHQECAEIQALNYDQVTADRGARHVLDCRGTTPPTPPYIPSPEAHT